MKMPRGKTAEVQLTYGNLPKTRSVKATVYGPLCVHWCAYNDAWKVSHVRTGWCVCFISSFRKARSCIKELLTVDCWDSDDPATINRLGGRTVLAIIRKHASKDDLVSYRRYLDAQTECEEMT